MSGLTSRIQGVSEERLSRFDRLPVPEKPSWHVAIMQSKKLDSNESKSSVSGFPLSLPARSEPQINHVFVVSTKNIKSASARDALAAASGQITVPAYQAGGLLGPWRASTCKP